MRTALVLDADSPAGLEALQSLGRKGLATHAASPDDCLAFRSRRVSRRWKQPISEPTAFLRWLRDLDAEQAYALIVPSTERSLRMLLSLPDDDALVAKAVLAPRASLETALDKWATAELALGIPVLVSRSGLTKMGHEVAARVGITMIGRAVGKHYLLFTGGHRLKKAPSSQPSPKGEGALPPSALGEGRGEGHR